MSSYAKNTDRPSTASVAQVEDTSGTDTHDPFDGNAGSLESSSGGSVDLSAVDQDVTVVNAHSVELKGVTDDPSAVVTQRFDDDYYGEVHEADISNGSTDFYVINPGDAVANGHWAKLTASPGGASLAMRAGSAFRILQCGANGWSVGASDVVFSSGAGPVLQSEDSSFWRLVVANDGTLSTEPVV